MVCFVNIRIALRTTAGGLVVAGALFLGAGAASAQQDDPYRDQPPASVLSSEIGEPATAAPEVAKVASDDALPVTGSDLAQLGLIGGGLVVAGVGMVAVRRRQTPTAV